MSKVLLFEAPPGKPVLRGHDHYWSVIRDLDRDGPWSIAMIRLLTGGGIDRTVVRDFVKRLVAGGIAREHGTVAGSPHYRLITSPRATPRLRRDGTPGLQGRGQTAMWNMIRGPLGRDGFTHRDIALYASTETVKIAPGTAKTYVKYLNKAGYLLCMQAATSRRLATYRLKPAMQTGPLPPLILRTHVVFDQNRCEAMGTVVAREVAP